MEFFKIFARLLLLQGAVNGNLVHAGDTSERNIRLLVVVIDGDCLRQLKVVLLLCGTRVKRIKLRLSLEGRLPHCDFFWTGGRIVKTALTTFIDEVDLGLR